MAKSTPSQENPQKKERHIWPMLSFAILDLIVLLSCIFLLINRRTAVKRIEQSLALLLSIFIIFLCIKVLKKIDPITAIRRIGQSLSLLFRPIVLLSIKVLKKIDPITAVKRIRQSLVLLFWPIILLSIIVLVFSAWYIINPVITTNLLSRLWTTFYDNRHVLLIILVLICLISFCLALFKKPHKWIYFGFFTCLTFIIVVAGQVYDYVTRSDSYERRRDAAGTTFYGDTLSSADYDNSYYNQKR